LNIRKTLVSLAILTLGLVGATSAQAQIIDTSGTATVFVMPALSITLVQAPSWGKIVIPPAGIARYTLDYSLGGVTTTVGGAGGGGYAANDGVAGEYTLTGAADAPVSFSVAFGTFSTIGVSLVEGNINGTSSSGTGTLSAGGSLTLKIGGIIDVSYTSTLGTHSSTVTVTANYE
jgi:hypothetical protein